MYKIEIIPEKALAVMVYWGDINFQEIMNANDELMTNPTFEQSFNGVVDHRKSIIDLSHEEIVQIAQSVSEKDLSFGKWVILVESPLATAFSVLYQDNIEHQHPQNVCSTIKGASEYLTVDLSEHLEKGSND